MAVMFALPLHFVGIRVLDIVIRVRVAVGPLVVIMMTIVMARFVMAMHIVGCVMSRVPGLLLLIIVLAGAVCSPVMTELALVLMLVTVGVFRIAQMASSSVTSVSLGDELFISHNMLII
jgi:hypothetical protein